MASALSGSYSRTGIDEPSPAPELTKVVEGYAAVLFPPSVASKAPAADEGGQDDQAVFYNPAQVVNRDLTICVMEAFSRMRKTETRRKGGVGEDGITILEALGATGLRTIRYWKEISGVRYIITNDLDPDAVVCMHRNFAFNGLPVGAPETFANAPAGFRGVIPNRDDAIVLMQRLGADPHGPHRLVGIPVDQPERGTYAPPTPQVPAEGAPQLSSAGTTTTPVGVVPLLQNEKMDIVDLDPYGTASPFLDPAMQCIKEGGLMCVTSTDSAILCGNYPDTAHAKYNSIPIKSDACHEMAVRVLLAAAERTANKRKKYIVPLLSLHIDFYVRVFFRVYTQPAEVKLSVCKMGHYYQCTRCPAYSITPVGRAKPHKKPESKKRGEKRERDPVLAEEKAAAAAAAAAAATAEPAETEAPALGFPVVHDRHIPFSVNASTISATTPKCSICQGAIALGGPLYCAPTQASETPAEGAEPTNATFLSLLLSVIAEKAAAGHITATDRITGLVTTARGELPHVPMFYEVPAIASLVRQVCPPLPRVVAAICRKGYQCSQVHCNKHGLKTDAPFEVLVGLLMGYKPEVAEGTTTSATAEGEQEEPAKVEVKETAVATAPKPGRQVYCPVVEGDFSYDAQYDFKKLSGGVPRFVPNAPGWGPRRRHQGAAKPTTPTDE